MGKKIIAICGPTACSKSLLAESCVSEYGGIIINADSRQIFQGLPILTACPTRYKTYHYLYEKYSCHEKITVYDWITNVKKIINTSNHNYYWIVGGTGFYIDSLLHGTYNIPQQTEKIYSIESNYNNLCSIDPKYAKIISRNDERRIENAIKIYNYTGKPLSSFNRIGGININICYLYRDDAKNAISQRLCDMISLGMIDEVSHFITSNIIKNNFNPIGLKEVIQYLKNEISFAEMKSSIIIKTAQYAKRQRTWFNNHKYHMKYNLTYEKLHNIITQVAM